MLKRLTVVILSVLTLLTTTTAQTNEMSFKKVETRTSFDRAKQGDNGKLMVSSGSIRFVRGNGRDEYFSIPSKAVTEVFYSRVSGRRIKTAIFVSPLLLFTKGKKHYLTLSFSDGKELVGAIEFKLHKSNYRGVLRAVEQVSGVTMKFDQEGVKAEQEGVATRDASALDEPTQAMAVLTITSEPENAEVEIDGVFTGMTPRTKKLTPGEYKIRISMKGYVPWERTIKVEAGEEIPLKVHLEKQ